VNMFFGGGLRQRRRVGTLRPVADVWHVIVPVRVGSLSCSWQKG
jgi:hypothetical protein